MTGMSQVPDDFVAGLEGVVAFTTEIAEPDKDGGALRYRGVKDLVLAAAGRTDRALIAVCRARDGRLEYNGVRLSDRAALHLTDVTTTAGGFAARNDDTSYQVSPKELLVTAGATTLSRDPMLEYRATPPRT